MPSVIDLRDVVCGCFHWGAEHNTETGPHGALTDTRLGSCAAPGCRCARFAASFQNNLPDAIADRGGEHEEHCKCALCVFPDYAPVGGVEERLRVLEETLLEGFTPGTTLSRQIHQDGVTLHWMLMLGPLGRPTWFVKGGTIEDVLRQAEVSTSVTCNRPIADAFLFSKVKSDMERATVHRRRKVARKKEGKKKGAKKRVTGRGAYAETEKLTKRNQTKRMKKAAR